MTDLEAPPDRGKLIYLIFIFHGIGVLTPWNMFITAKPYYMEFKMHKNYTGVESVYTKYFMNYLCFACQIPNILFNWLNVFIQFKCKVDTKIMLCLSFELIFIFITIVLAIVNSQNWPTAFFWVTIFTAVCMYSGSAIYQNSLYGVVVKLPPRYIAGIMLGNNAAGLFITMISIISNLAVENKRTATIYYFVAAFMVLFQCMVFYFALPINKFYRFYDLKFRKILREDARRNLENEQVIPYCKIFKKAFPQLLNIWLVFFVSYLLYPAVYSHVLQCDPEFFIPPKFFTSITCYLVYNLFSMVGNLTSLLVIWPKPRYVFIPVWLRLLYIPLLLMCNYQPPDTKRTMHAWIWNDWCYIVIGATLGYTNGYFSAVVMVYVPQTVELVHKSVAGKIGAASMLTGVFCGIVASFLCPTIVSKIH